MSNQDSTSNGVSEVAELTLETALWAAANYITKHSHRDPQDREAVLKGLGWAIERYARVHQPVENQDKKVLFGELWLDAEGEAHFVCHTKDDDFLKTKEAFQKFIALLETQIRNEKECPFYASDSGEAKPKAPSHSSVVIPESISLTLAEIRERQSDGYEQVSKGHIGNAAVAAVNDVRTLLSIIDSLQAEKESAVKDVKHWRTHARNMENRALANIADAASAMRTVLIKRVRNKAAAYWNDPALNELATELEAVELTQNQELEK